MGSLLAIHVDSVFAINLLEVDLHLLDECGGDVLAHEIRSNREFAVATIDEDGQANAGRPSKIQQRIEGRADAPAGKEDIVHEDDGRAIDGHGNFAWTNRRRCRPARHIVAVKADVQRADRDSHAFELFNGRNETTSERIPTREETDDHQAFSSTVVFDYFVAEPADCTVDFVGTEIWGGSHEKRLPRGAGQARARLFLPAMPAPPPLAASRDRFKGFHRGYVAVADLGNVVNRNDRLDILPGKSGGDRRRRRLLRSPD
jgi:hypothetical protein